MTDTDTETSEQTPSYQLKQSPEFEEWLKKLKDYQAKKQILGRLFRIQEDGFFGDTKGVGDNVSELRFHGGAGYRLYYTIQGNTVVFLLYGGNKSSQDKDIEKAKTILKNWSSDDE